MTKTDKIWINLMEWFCKYWGCHQMPERSFFFKGYQLPICARCTGVIIGELLALTSIFYSLNLLILIPLMVPLVFDGLLQYYTNYESNNIKRVITGLLFGYSFISTIISIIKLIINSI